jgi:L-fuculose-phosphate aldolase
MDKIKDRMIRIGRAMLTLGIQNTHSGNISVRVGDEMYITKTGAMKGHLEERDIVLPGLFEPKSGLFQASSETGTHRKILEYAGSAIHTHSLSATLLSYILDTLQPVDALGKNFIKSIPVIEFEYPVGSKEMENRIPEILKDHPGMIIKTHGPMTRGSTVEESFFILNIIDYSSEILLNLKMLGVALKSIPKLSYPRLGSFEGLKGVQTTRDRELIHQFKRVSSDIFTMKLSPFQTGSISVRDGNEMLYCSSASLPQGMESDIHRVELQNTMEDYFICLHQAVYRYSHSQAAIFSHSPLALVQSFKLVSLGKDRIIPIDAEGGYLYPAIPIVMPDEDLKSIIRRAESYKMVVIAGVGALAVGQTPTHCIHHNSSLKNISYLKIQLEMMERVNLLKNAEEFLDERGKDW